MQAQTLTDTLRQARKALRLSQLELSLRLGVSQRHVSFVESGRARPSRDLLLAWLHELNVPLVLRNEALLQAGYAPAYTAALPDDPVLTQVNQALGHLLTAHDPMPALVIDAQWNLLRLNRGGQWLAATLLPAAVDLTGAASINLLDLFIHPKGLTQSLLNLHEVGPPLLSLLRQEATIQTALTPKVEAFAAILETRLGKENLQGSWPRSQAPVLTSRYATQYGELSFFSMFTTFGTPQDISLASLRVEHMFAADEATHEILKAQVT